MRNLLHVPIDKLESLPSRQQYNQILTSKFRIERSYNYRRYNNHAFNTLWNKIVRIIHGSIGENWDEVYAKLREMAKVPYDFDLDGCIAGRIAIPCWSLRNQRWEYKKYAWGKNYDLLDHIDLIKRIRSNSVERFYYVCPISNVIRMVKSKLWESEKDSSFWRRHYKLQYERRTRHKETRKNRKREGDFLIALINKPELFKFYTSIKKEYEALLRDLAWEERHYNSYRQSKSLKERQFASIYKPAKYKLEKLNSLKDQIEDLEKGNFDVFFESAVYLYSQQKECHHFETP